MTTRLFPFGVIVSVAVSAVLTGCGGGSSPSTPTMLPAGGAPVQSAAVLTQSAHLDTFFSDAKRCKSDHGVSVKPCSVTLTITQPTATVTTKGPNGGTFTEKDNCASKGIATVAGTGNNYTVTAGATTGKCRAVFTDKSAKGKEIGDAVLTITNKV